VKLVDRARKILLEPATEWPVIAAEAADTKALFLSYAAPLAAIGALAMWIGHSVVGVSVPLLGTYRTPLGAGLAFAIATWILGLAGAFVCGLIVNALAPTFGGEKSTMQAMKCAVYAYTPAWIAAILHVIPALGIVVVLASLYGLYLLWLGLPVLMKAPKEKSLGYTVVVVICVIAVSIVLSVVGGLLGLAGIGPRGMGPIGGDAITGALRPDAKPAPDSVLGKLDAMSRKLEESGKRMEEADRRGDTAGAVGAAMEGLATLASGGKKVTPVGADTLRSFLPATLDGMPRGEVTTEQSSFGPMTVTMASATYRDGSRRVRLGIGDMAAAGGILALTSMLGAGQTKESDSGYERFQRVDGRLVIEKLDRRSGAAEYGVVVADRYAVAAASSNVDPQALRAAIARLDLAKLEAMKDAGVAK
jgi:hypothetical protein